MSPPLPPCRTSSSWPPKTISGSVDAWPLTVSLSESSAIAGTVKVSTDCAATPYVSCESSWYCVISTVIVSPTV